MFLFPFSGSPHSTLGKQTLGEFNLHVKKSRSLEKKYWEQIEVVKFIWRWFLLILYRISFRLQCVSTITTRLSRRQGACAVIMHAERFLTKLKPYTDPFYSQLTLLQECQVRQPLRKKSIMSTSCSRIVAKNDTEITPQRFLFSLRSHWPVKNCM